MEPCKVMYSCAIFDIYINAAAGQCLVPEMLRSRLQKLSIRSDALACSLSSSEVSFHSIDIHVLIIYRTQYYLVLSHTTCCRFLPISLALWSKKNMKVLSGTDNFHWHLNADISCKWWKLSVSITVANRMSQSLSLDCYLFPVLVF